MSVFTGNLLSAVGKHIFHIQLNTSNQGFGASRSTRRPVLTTELVLKTNDSVLLLWKFWARCGWSCPNRFYRCWLTETTVEERFNQWIKQDLMRRNGSSMKWPPKEWYVPPRRTLSWSWKSTVHSSFCNTKAVQSSRVLLIFSFWAHCPGMQPDQPEAAYYQTPRSSSATPSDGVCLITFIYENYWPLKLGVLFFNL